MKSIIPHILLYSRLVIAGAMFVMALFLEIQSATAVLVLMYIGMLSDVFDGILARKYGASTTQLRVQDTAIDLVFYLSIVYFAFTSNPDYILKNKILLLLIAALELLMYLTSLIRFKRLPSPHAILSKFWGIYIVIELTLILLKIDGVHFTIALFVGIIAHADRVFIYMLLPEWDHDIPTCYHAYLLRKGIEIKRLKLFNG